MIGQRKVRLTGIALAAAFVLATTVLLVGCAGTSSTSTTTTTTTASATSTSTALAGLSAAQASLLTTAPDAKLLVVQTAQAVTTTGTPVWAYLFGSPSSDKTYVVYVANGASMGAQLYGTAGLTTSEWSKVPTTTTWKIDSDAAYTKALAVSGASGTPTAYMMGFMTYKPASDTSTIDPFVWSVEFEAGSSGATTSAINVNMNTGAAAIAK
jgi:hypothetical protein